MVNFDDLRCTWDRMHRNGDGMKAAVKAAMNAAYGRAALDYTDTDSIRYDNTKTSWNKNDIYRYCAHDIKATEDTCMRLSSISWYDWLSNNIQRVIFNKPYTIVIFKDKTKSVVKASNEEYDPEKGFVMALLKRILSPESSKYYKLVKKYCDDASQTEENVKRIKKMNEEYEQDKGFGSILDRFLKGVAEDARRDNK